MVPASRHGARSPGAALRRAAGARLAGLPGSAGLGAVGVPRPERTASGYRLYGPRELAEVRRMLQLIEAGTAASEAARQILEGPVARTRQQSESGPAAPDAGGTLAEAFAAVRSFEPRRLERILGASEGSVPAATLFQTLLSPLMVRIGEAWQRGELGVAEEHLASSVVERQLTRLLGSAQPLEPTGLALLACVAGERHLLPLHGAALGLAQEGYRIVLLGADTPAEAVAEAVRRLEPKLLGLSITTLPRVDDLRGFLATYARAAGTTRWRIGGRAVPELVSLVTELGGEVDSR